LWHTMLKSFDLGLIFLKVIIFVYVLMMHTSFGEDAGHIADSWLMRSKKFAFWGGLTGIGLLLPGVLYLIADEGSELSLALAGVLLGGLILRFLVVYSDERKKLPGEV
jgi:protein NrfD